MNTHVSIYQFPDTAFRVQVLTAEFLMANSRGYVLNDLGTGKTRAVLFAFDYFNRTEGSKLLVICPLSALEKTWAREIRNEFPWLTYQILHGDKKKRLERLNQDADIYIVNHHGVEVIFDELQQRRDLDTFAVDECATYRNGRSNLTLKLRLLVRGRDRVWGITGSPMPRAVTDTWGQCSIFTPNTIPRYFSQFRAQLMLKANQFKWEPKPGAELRAVACMRPSVRFTLDEVTELPPRVINYYSADMGPFQHKAYMEMKNRAVTLIDDGKVDALNAGAVMSKLLQIALGVVYKRDGTEARLDNKPRLQLILDLVDSAQQKVILFSAFKSGVRQLSEMLTDNKVDHAIVTGDVPYKQRNAIFSAFQDTRRYKVLVAHPACMSHSLTLTSASTTIWAGPHTSLDVFMQANARTYRVGQTHKTLIAMVGGTGVEQRIYRLLGRNEAVQNRFLDIIKGQTEEEYNG